MLKSPSMTALSQFRSVPGALLELTMLLLRVIAPETPPPTPGTAGVGCDIMFVPGAPSAAVLPAMVAFVTVAALAPVKRPPPDPPLPPRFGGEPPPPWGPPAPAPPPSPPGCGGGPPPPGGPPAHASLPVIVALVGVRAPMPR